MQDDGLFALLPIASERLDLRPLRVVDAEAFRAMTDEPGITEIVHFLSSPFTLADAERLIAGAGDGRDCFWGLLLRREGVLVGSVGTHLSGADEIEIGYWLATAWHGRGLASEAVAAMLPALAAGFPARRIVAECRPANRPSWRLLERVGFVPDGADGHRAGRKRLALPRP